MKTSIVVIALAGAMSTAAVAAEYAPQEFDFSELGTIESVREVPLAHPLRDAFEHSINPETADEVVVRFDDGRAVVLRRSETPRLAPGQRVRLDAGPRGVLVAPN
jgi:outer membrane lipoprotein SlyB